MRDDPIGKTAKRSKRTSKRSRRVKVIADAKPSLYQRIGAEKIQRLVAAFYARVDRDPVIRPFYGKTLTCAIHALTDFMITWLGGPSVYDIRGARLRRRHMPFPIDARARDAWLANMKAALRDVGIPAAEARLLLAHLEFGANALMNTGKSLRKPTLFPAGKRFDVRLTEEWKRMAQAEELFDAASRGDLPLVRTMLPKRLVPHARLMRHALTDWLDPTGRADGRFGRRPRQTNPLQVIETLLAHRDLDLDPDEGNELDRFLHLQAMMEVYARTSMFRAASARTTGWGGDEKRGRESFSKKDSRPLSFLGPNERESSFHAALRSATRDRFLSEIQRDPSCVRLLGPRDQTLLRDAAMFGEAELATALIRAGADPDARETEGHTPLYRASTGQVARVLLEAGATADTVSGPTRGTPLHQAARRGSASVAQALIDHGATIDARDAKGQTPLRRAINCRQPDIARLLIRHGADPHFPDRHGVTPLHVAKTAEMKQALVRVGA